MRRDSLASFVHSVEKRPLAALSLACAASFVVRVGGSC
jgi:hypothetical protein